MTRLLYPELAIGKFDPESVKSADEELLIALRNQIKSVKARIDSRKYRANSINAQKEAARMEVALAIRDGSLAALPCENCAAKKTQAHHDDYSKALEIRWLCRKCHAAHHRSQKTHCANGHPWIPENIYVTPNGKRQYCITCQRLRNDDKGERMAEQKRLIQENTALSEEIKASYSHVDALEAVLEQCRDFVEARADITDGDHGPKPNPAMLLLQQIEEVMP